MLKKIFVLLGLISAGAAVAGADFNEPPSDSSISTPTKVAFSSARPAQVVALIHNKLLNDPMAPVVGAEHPVLKIVSFVNYDCIHCRQLDSNLEKLLKAYPQIAITYRLISYGSEASTAATRMALTVWIEQPEKFHAFHHALMAYPGMADDDRIRSALRTAGVKLNKFRPDTYHLIEVNKELLRTLQYSGTPTTFIGDRVLLGAVSYEDLASAVDAALEDEKVLPKFLPGDIIETVINQHIYLSTFPQADVSYQNINMQ
ncbi:thioredoxin domain-containing protein [Pantoea sp. EA-12]|uniref:DsbA family protein n=1 Tax=Pantoea sp. EA-12 TaxID=3043303 RepID=UPI0024B5419C|nr:thioredoxin domain-containing protein [Pantoea sp. EA-12]MDI9222514.1 thioredoxin domain-containing protein [Pantoea sp. EA-12]